MGSKFQKTTPTFHKMNDTSTNPKLKMQVISSFLSMCVTIVGCIIGGATGGIAASVSLFLAAMCSCALFAFQIVDKTRKDPGWFDRPSTMDDP